MNRIETELTPDYSNHLKSLTDTDLINELSDCNKWLPSKRFIKRTVPIQETPIKWTDIKLKIQLFKERSTIILWIILDRQISHKLLEI